MAVNNDESRAYLYSSGLSGTFNMFDSSVCSVSMWVEISSFGPEVGPLTTLLFTQDETLYDGAGSNGTFVGGDGVGVTEYAIGNLITLSNGSTIIVDAVDGNSDVTEFTVLSPGDADIASGVTLTQSSATGTGIDFTLTPGDNNITGGRKGLPTVDLLTLRGSTGVSFTISIIPDNVLPSPIDPTAAKVVVISTNASTGKKQLLMSSTTFDFTAGWANILLSWDSAASTGNLYLNDSDELLTGVVNTDGEIVSSLFAPVFDGNSSGIIGDDPLDLSTLSGDDGTLNGPWNHLVSVTYPTSSADVDVHNVYFNNVVAIDFSVVGNRRDFIAASGDSVDLGVNGELPTGSSPALFLPNPAASYEVNAGTNNDWIINGGFIDIVAPPEVPPGPSVPQPPPTPFAWWDGSDLTTLFQDVGGITPTALNGDLVRRVNNKGVGASHNLITGPADVDVTWDSSFQNSLGGIFCTTAFAQISATIDASMSNGAWTQAIVASVSVPAQFSPIIVAAYKSFFQGFGVGPSALAGDCFVVKDPVGSEIFTDSNPIANQVFAMIMSWQTDGTLDAICSISTEIKSVNHLPYVEPLIGDTTIIGGGSLSSNVKVGELVVWDSLISFASIKTYHFDKWGITYV